MSRSSLLDFMILTRLGAGSFGAVYKALRKKDQQIYVIKRVKLSNLQTNPTDNNATSPDPNIKELNGSECKQHRDALNEVNLLSTLKNNFVVQYYDSFIEKDALYIVMEHCNRGDLQNLLKKAKEKNVAGIKEVVVWNIILQIFLGLHYLHTKHVLHRDLKTANVFLTKNEIDESEVRKNHYQVKIGDLGVAKLMDATNAFASTVVGTPYYLSPELCRDLPYKDKSDCWALGVLMYECCTLHRPFEARNQCALIMKIIESPVEPPPVERVGPTLRTIIMWLLEKKPENRPSVRELLNEIKVREKIQEYGLELPPEVLALTPTDHITEKYRKEFPHESLPTLSQTTIPSSSSLEKALSPRLSNNENPALSDSKVGSLKKQKTLKEIDAEIEAERIQQHPDQLSQSKDSYPTTSISRAPSQLIHRVDSKLGDLSDEPAAPLVSPRSKGINNNDRIAEENDYQNELENETFQTGENICESTSSVTTTSATSSSPTSIINNLIEIEQRIKTSKSNLIQALGEDNFYEAYLIIKKIVISDGGDNERNEVESSLQHLGEVLQKIASNVSPYDIIVRIKALVALEESYLSKKSNI